MLTRLLLVLVIGLFTKNICVLATSIRKCDPSIDTGRHTLETKNGKIIGNCEYVNANDGYENLGSNVYHWLGIPYAQAPVGPNRFKKPMSVQNWTQTLDGTKWPNSCMTSSSVSQLADNEKFAGFSMWLTKPEYTNASEDCLYLNIWLPDIVYLKLNENKHHTGESPKVPIMVFIHGSSGTTVLDIYNPSTFVAVNNIIVVTISYRAGLLGSLYLKNTELNGNQGLLDQHEALKWIYENADMIGGDRERITLVGSSLGAMSIGYHLAYKPSWSYFNNVILQAGSPFNPSIQPVNSNEANQFSREFLIYLNCGTTESSNEDLALCAMSKSYDELNKISNEYFLGQYLKYNSLANAFLRGFFRPVIDGNIIKEPLADSYKNGNVKNCSLMTGFTSNEGSMFAAYTGILGTNTEELSKRPLVNHSALKNFINSYYEFYPQYFHKSSKALLTSILFEYTNLLNDDEGSSLLKSNYFNDLSRIIGDSSFTCPGVELATFYSRINPNVFAYLNNHRLSTSPWPAWYGVTHGDELALIFGQPLTDRSSSLLVSENPWARYSLYKPNERALSRSVMTYWSNFIKFNNPNDESDLLGNWTPYATDGSSDKNFFMINSNSKIVKNYGVDKCNFWSSLVPVFVQEQIKNQNNCNETMKVNHESTTQHAVKLTRHLFDKDQSSTTPIPNKCFFMSANFYLIIFLYCLFL